MADRSKKPIVHFVGSIPLPDNEAVFRTLSAGDWAASFSLAGRGDRHPQNMDTFSAGRARRTIRRSNTQLTCRRSSSCNGTARSFAKSRGSG